MPRLCLVTLTCLALLTPFVPAEETRTPLAWPFRAGPTLNGHAAAAEADELPVEFDIEKKKNVRWSLELEGSGHSTPTVADGKVWLTSATKDGKKQYVWALNAETGDVIFHRLLFENENPESLNNDINTYASPSCALEGDAVYVHFGSYGTARLDPETCETVWERRDISCRHYRGPGSSPIIHKHVLLLTFDGVDQQFLMGLDKRTGKTVWRTTRSTDYGDLDENGVPKREGDLRKAYSTPGLIKINGRTQMFSMGSRAGFAYDALTGEEIWGIRHDDFNAAAPPCFYGNFAILNTGSSRANLLSVRLDETTRGDVTDSHVVWDRPKGNSRLSSPILAGNLIFMVTHTGVATCVNADSGEEVWKDRLGGTYIASPVAANGNIYFCSDDGAVTVIRASDTFEVVARNRLPAGIRSSPSIAGGNLYIRTFTHLYCLGQD